jgi:hypothetical protein
LTEGLLWHDTRDGDLASKVHAAAERYEEKFGVKLDTCHVHPVMLPKRATPTRVGQIEVLGNASIMSDHFWVGAAGQVVDGRDG